MESKVPLAKLVTENGDVYIYNTPFQFGRRSGKSTEDFMDICVTGVDKSVSREYATIVYSEEKVGWVNDDLLIW